MIARLRTDLPPDVYPDDPWALVEDAFAPRFLYLTETIFALSNGTIGLRGTLDEGAPAHVHGTYVNGFHETWPIVHPESAYGFARTGQTIVDVPDASVIEVTVDGDTFGCRSPAMSSYRRWLDFRTGVLERTVEWTAASGTRVTMWSRRLVSLAKREIAAFWLEILVDRSADVTFRSRVVNRQDMLGPASDRGGDPRRAALTAHRVLEPRAATVDGPRIVQGWVTTNSRLGLLTGVDHALMGGEATLDLHREADDYAVVLDVAASPGRSLELTKIATYHSFAGEAELDDRLAVDDALDSALGLGFNGLAELQKADLDSFWAAGDIEVDAGPEIQRAVRWTLFQLHQASATIDEWSIPAKGLTGQAYDGHYFWDTEIYVVPFLVYTDPRAAARILRFRYRMLDKARQRATELSHRGALFPWRTINGEEASAYFLAGTAQYHINADIVYALRKYVEVTGDEDLLWDIGVEIAIETARLWADVGFFRAGRFHINGVTGPDEYTALVDDNAYTNVMARMNLRFAADAVDRMAAEAPDRFAALEERLRVESGETRNWRLAADSMYVPYDPDLGITPQDDDFLVKEPWDFENTPPSKYPLLLHFHPLVIYRHQVLKQADVVLADFLVGDEFSAELKRANFDYYDPITTGDSSLSACVQSIMAAEIGYADKALSHFQHALFIDLADLAGNTTDGVHMASAGGVWMALVYGFAGLRDHGGRITFTPRLPEEWKRLRFGLLVRGNRLVVDIDHRRLVAEATGGPIEITVGESSETVTPDRLGLFLLDPPQAASPTVKVSSPDVVS